MHWQNVLGKFQYPVAPAGVAAENMASSAAVQIVI
jgi:hypothetical protein